VVVVSSGAAVAGSPPSGGYAGAKATQRFMTGYAQDEANRAGLGITFTAVLPRITPLTDLGRPAIRAYALAVDSPRTTTSSSWASRSPQRSPAPPWSSCYGQTSPPSHPVSC